jgi:hypothetical protein
MWCDVQASPGADEIENGCDSVKLRAGTFKKTYWPASHRSGSPAALLTVRLLSGSPPRSASIPALTRLLTLGGPPSST